MKLLRTIRLDPSDTFVFERAAELGEWAVSGAFMFWAADPAQLEGKARTAFRNGFLGVGSFGRSTLVQIVDAKPADRTFLIDLLAQRLIERCGAPDMHAARLAAEDEVDFVQSLCNQPHDTLIAVHRSFDGGGIREQFRTLRPRQGKPPARAFSFMEVEGDEEEPGEAFDLVGMAGHESK
jgi:hypothetical protein